MTHLGKLHHTLYTLLQLAYIRSDAVHIKCGIPSGLNCIVWHCAAIIHVPLATTSYNTILLSHNTTQCSTVDLWDQSKFSTGVKPVKPISQPEKKVTDLTVSFNLTSVTRAAGGQITQSVFFLCGSFFDHILFDKALETTKNSWCKMQMHANNNQV